MPCQPRSNERDSPGFDCTRQAISTGAERLERAAIRPALRDAGVGDATYMFGVAPVLFGARA
jgi:hypothetical protein